MVDHGSPDPWAHPSQLGPGSYSGSAGSYSNSYGMHPRDGMVSACLALHIIYTFEIELLWQLSGAVLFLCCVMIAHFVCLLLE